MPISATIPPVPSCPWLGEEQLDGVLGLQSCDKTSDSLEQKQRKRIDSSVGNILIIGFDYPAIAFFCGYLRFRFLYSMIPRCLHTRQETRF